MSSVERKLSSDLSTRSNTRRTVRQQKMARGLKFRIKKVNGYYYLHACSEKETVDQLRIYCTTDLRLCFRVCKKQLFLLHGSDKAKTGSY